MADYGTVGFEGEEKLDGPMDLGFEQNPEAVEVTPDSETENARNEVEIKYLKKSEVLAEGEVFLGKINLVYEAALKIENDLNQEIVSPGFDQFTYNDRNEVTRRVMFDFLREKALSELGSERDPGELHQLNEELKELFGLTEAQISQNEIYQQLRALETPGEEIDEIALANLLVAKCQALYAALVMEQAFARAAFERREFIQHKNEAQAAAKKGQPQEVVKQAQARLASLNRFADYINSVSTLGEDFYTANNGDAAVKIYYYHLLEKYIDISETTLERGDDQNKMERDPLELFCREAKFIDESINSWEEVEQIAEENQANAVSPPVLPTSEEVNLDLNGAELAGKEDLLVGGNEAATEQGIENADFSGQIADVLAENKINSRVEGKIARQAEIQNRQAIIKNSNDQFTADLYGATPSAANKRLAA